MGSPSPFVALMRRYVEDYTNAHDLDVCDRIFHPDYRIHIGGSTLGFDDYKVMVRDAFARFPDLQLVVHQLVTNGERLGMHFSEHATSPAHGNRRAVWEGVGLYRRAPDGRLIENFVEQDFYGRRAQLASDEPPSVPRQDPAVWATPDAPSSRATENAVRAWVAARNDGELDGSDHLINDGMGGIPVRGVITAGELFSAGSRFAVRLSVRGTYTGALYGVPQERRGREAALDAVAIGQIGSGGTTEMRLISDRFGLRRRLKI
jgi:hypothetical protein